MTMTFEKGVPTSVNGKKMKVSEIIATLNELGGRHGIGIVDIVENRVVACMRPPAERFSTRHTSSSRS